MKPRKPLPRSTTPIARSRKVKSVNVRRKKKEFARSYGSVDRVVWMASHGCLFATESFAALRLHLGQCLGPIDNAHLVTGGMGRKADAKHILPMCRLHHHEFDTHAGLLFSDPAFRSELIPVALMFDAEWQKFAAPSSKGQ